MIRVRLAEHRDLGRLIDYIRDDWAEHHVFVEAPEVFEWQHLQRDGRLNMFIAERVMDEEETVLGVLGFIPMGRFDPELGDTDVTLAIWKVRAGSPPGLGLRLLKQLQSELQPRMIAAIGISDIVAPIYKVLRYQVGTLDHTAIFNPDRADLLEIAGNIPAEAFASDDPSWPDNVRLEPIDAAAGPATRSTIEGLAAAALPSKSWSYIESRYLDHPWYDYTVSLVHHNDSPASVVVWRTVTAESATVLRIVDVIGSTDWLAHSRRVLLATVIAADAEYIDLMQWGTEPSILDEAGFVGPRTHADAVIPNYFSPFEPRNIEIELALRILEDSGLPLHLYRADSDQDRPNTPQDLDRSIS